MRFEISRSVALQEVCFIGRSLLASRPKIVLKNAALVSVSVIPIDPVKGLENPTVLVEPSSLLFSKTRLLSFSLPLKCLTSVWKILGLNPGQCKVRWGRHNAIKPHQRVGKSGTTIGPGS